MKLFRPSRVKPDLTTRAVVGRSGYEIAALREYFGHSLSTALYFYDDRAILAAAMTGTPGNGHAELRPPIVLTEPVADESLGFSALEALLHFDSSPATVPAGWKGTDWPTFKASGAKSIKAFERSCCFVWLRTVNAGGIEIEGSCLKLQDSTIRVRAWVPISVEHSELGQVLRTVVRGAHLLRDEGVY